MRGQEKGGMSFKMKHFLSRIIPSPVETSKVKHSEISSNSVNLNYLSIRYTIVEQVLNIFQFDYGCISRMGWLLF